MTARPTFRATHFRSVACLLFLVARVPEMIRASPWIDEAANWALASLEPSLRPPTHVLTYASQAAALSLSDSVIALRLPSLLFTLAAYLLLCEWAWRRLGRGAALAFALLFSLSPIGVFYSIDANHYGALLLAGTLIFLGLEAPARRRTGWAAMVAATAAALAAPGFHPLGAFLTGAWFAALWLWLLREAPRLAPSALGPRRARLLVLLGGLIAAALVIALFDPLGRMGERASQPYRDERLPGLSPAFWLPLLADYYGRLFHHHPLDILAGLLGAATAAAGWVLLIRRRRARRAALTGGCLVLCLVGPFLVLYFTTYFYPKFWVPLLPVLLMGNAAFLAAALKGGGLLVRPAAAAFLAVFLLCAALFQVRMITHDYQPTRQLLSQVAEEFPGGTLLASRLHYSSRSLGFLAAHPSTPPVPFLALDPLEFAPGPAIQQLEEAVWAHDAPVLFTSLLETREHNAPEFTAWLEENTTLRTVFDSLAVDDFIPFDRRLHLREVHPPARSPFALPRDGSRASALLGTRHIEGRGILHGSLVLLPPGTGAAWNIELAGGGASAGIALGYRLEGTPGEEDWLLAHLSGGAAFAVPAGRLSGRGTLLLPGPFAQEGRQVLSLVVVTGSAPVRPAPFRIAPLELREGPGGEDAIVAHPLEPLLAKEGEVRRRTDVRGRGVFPGGTLSLEGRPQGRAIALFHRIHPRGLANTGVRTVVTGEGGERAILSLPVERTVAPVRGGAVLQPVEGTEELRWEIRSSRLINEVFLDPVLEYWEPVIYLLPPPEDITGRGDSSRH